VLNCYKHVTPTESDYVVCHIATNTELWDLFQFEDILIWKWR